MKKNNKVNNNLKVKDKKVAKKQFKNIKPKKNECVEQLVLKNNFQYLLFLFESIFMAERGMRISKATINDCFEILVKVLQEYDSLKATNEKNLKIINDSAKANQKFHKEFDSIEDEVWDKLEAWEDLTGKGWVADISTNNEKKLGIFDRKTDQMVREYDDKADYRINIDEDLKTDFKRDKYFSKKVGKIVLEMKKKGKTNEE